MQQVADDSSDLRPASIELKPSGQLYFGARGHRLQILDTLFDGEGRPTLVPYSRIDEHEHLQEVLQAGGQTSTPRFRVHPFHFSPPLPFFFLTFPISSPSLGKGRENETAHPQMQFKPVKRVLTIFFCANQKETNLAFTFSQFFPS